MPSLSDNWSIKSFPVNVNEVKKNIELKQMNSSVASDENESILCRRLIQVLGTPSPESEKSSCSDSQPDEKS
jgi:hypothetical protein